MHLTAGSSSASGWNRAPVRLRFAGAPLAEALTPALAHLRVPDDLPADLTVHLWDTQLSGEPLSPLVEVLAEQISVPLRVADPPARDHRDQQRPRARHARPLVRRGPAFTTARPCRPLDRVRDAVRDPLLPSAAPPRTSSCSAGGCRTSGCESVHAAAVGERGRRRPARRQGRVRQVDHGAAVPRGGGSATRPTTTASSQWAPCCGRTASTTRRRSTGSTDLERSRGSSRRPRTRGDRRTRSS